MSAYCVKCRAKRTMRNPRPAILRNRKRATTGTCPVCRTKMFRIERQR